VSGRTTESGVSVAHDHYVFSRISLKWKNKIKISFLEIVSLIEIHCVLQCEFIILSVLPLKFKEKEQRSELRCRFT